MRVFVQVGMGLQERLLPLRPLRGCLDGGQRWQDVLNRPNMIRAVNQEVVSADVALKDGDEVAFFPPVTGG